MTRNSVVKNNIQSAAHVGCSINKKIPDSVKYFTERDLSIEFREGSKKMKMIVFVHTFEDKNTKGYILGGAISNHRRSQRKLLIDDICKEVNINDINRLEK